MASFERILKFENLPSELRVTSKTTTTNEIVIGTSIQSIFTTTATACSSSHNSNENVPNWRTDLMEDIDSIVSNRDGSLIAAVTSTSISILNGLDGNVLMTKHVGVSGKHGSYIFDCI